MDPLFMVAITKSLTPFPKVVTSFIKVPHESKALCKTILDINPNLILRQF